MVGDPELAVRIGGLGVRRATGYSWVHHLDFAETAAATVEISALLTEALSWGAPCYSAAIDPSARL